VTHAYMGHMLIMYVIYIHAYSYKVVGRDWLKFDLISVGDDRY
jgi:hypothetical protein